MYRHGMGVISFCLNLYRQELCQEFDLCARVFRQGPVINEPPR